MSILATVPADHIVSVSEDVAASPAEVFGAFTDPLRLAGWYGPAGWLVPVHTISLDPRPGGTLRLVMVNHADPSQAVPMYATYVSVVENELLEHRESLPGPDGEATDASVFHRIEFLEREVEGRTGTRVVVSQGAMPPEIHETVASGWRSALRKLAETVESQVRAG
ncbi:SRPBCC family protein [Rothia halotolerans]|uniref:SRPBCC family protein n=1 Tax=Rothia halotolerans TaxID=405770 RepID=UPI00101BFBB0|nr:SRPBCC domain-containing protein [Rothia halotolerans]